jgi:hypothetical protein
VLAGYSMALLPCHLIASNKEVSSVPAKRKQMKVSAKLLVNYDIKTRET